MKIILLTIVIMAIAMFLMAIGAILVGKCLRGSCGGPTVLKPDSDELTCGTCGRKKKVNPSRE